MLGKEKPWRDALQVMCNTPNLSSKPILEYFKPLEVWLDAHRNANNYTIGWEGEMFPEKSCQNG